LRFFSIATCGKARLRVGEGERVRVGLKERVGVKKSEGERERGA